MKLFTIGHSNHTIEKFIHLLEQHGIAALVDIRSATDFAPEGIRGQRNDQPR
jgi:hypothetical protein